MQGEKGESASVIGANGSLMVDMAGPTRPKGVKVIFPAIAFTFQHFPVALDLLIKMIDVCEVLIS